MRDWKSTGLVILALIGGYIAARTAVGLFFDGAASYALSIDERAPDSNTVAFNASPRTASAGPQAQPSAPQPQAASTPATPGWGANPSSNGSGWNADTSWNGGPRASASAPMPAPPSAPAAPSSANASQ